MLQDCDVVFNAISDPIMILDLNNKILEINSAAESACKLPYKEIIGKKCHEIFHCLDHPPTGCPNEKLKIKQVPETNDMPVETLNATFMVTVAPIFNTQGKMIKSVHIAHDITDRKESEIERERLISELNRKSEEMEQLLYVSSHDLRSPLVNVDGYSKELEYSLKELMSTLENENMPLNIKEQITSIVNEDIPESMHYIRASTMKMSKLLKGILKLSRLGRFQLKVEELDMNKMMDSVVSNHAFRLKELKAKVDISELPKCTGDYEQLDQVFTNLLDNAIKYLDPGRSGIIHISGYEEGKRAVYCIEDNGIGSAPEYKDKLFEIFYQLTPNENQGEGMGLAIAKKLVERINGKIWVESELGKGSKFFVELPKA